jgi:hypothetical protein
MRCFQRDRIRHISFSLAVPGIRQCFEYVLSLAEDLQREGRVPLNCAGGNTCS